MSTKAETATNFLRGRPARCHNAHTNGNVYVLHETTICSRNENGTYTFNWGGFYTRTTASHMNAILAGRHAPFRVSYAEARNTGATAFTINVDGVLQ